MPNWNEDKGVLCFQFCAVLSGYLGTAERAAIALVIHQKDYLLLLAHKKV